MMAAAAGMMLAACSEDNLQVANTPQQAVSDVAVGFDTYLSQSNKTRAGMTDVMTNAKLQYSEAEKGGFGVFAVQHNASIVAQSKEKATNYRIGDWATAEGNNAVAPNFMWNQGVFYSASAWGYTPLKYWPNETYVDMQTTPAQSQTPGSPGTEKRTRDRVSFFAYAPYINFTAAVGSNYPTTAGASTQYPGVINYTPYGSSATTTGTDGLSGIKAITGYQYANDDPKVYYQVETTKPENSVDLLWGVAPAGGLNYTAVNNEEVIVNEGMPLWNLEKPSENQKIKFLFQHALSRLSLTIVAALDQIGAGGEFEAGPTTKINVREVKVKGAFNTAGWLNLSNLYKNTALWNWNTSGASPYPTNVQSNPNTVWLFTMQNYTEKGEDGTGSTNNGNQLLNESIWDLGGNIDAQTEGVLTTEKSLMNASVDPAKKKTDNTNTQNYVKGTSLWIENGTTGNAQETKAANIAISAGDFYYADGDTYKPIEAKVAGALEMAGSSKQVYYATSSFTDKVGDGSKTFASAFGATGTATYYKKDASGNYVTPTEYAQTDNIPNTETWAKVTPTEIDYKTYFKYGDHETYYTGILPRYWMVIPSYTDGSTVTEIPVTVQITYYVTTKDNNLSGGFSRVENIIEKTVPVRFESGKSYNLKLILGLTSVKLAAEVSDWKLAGDTEVNLPQNVE